ncbi:retrovirus-related pol polyprotein from transposon TNT 1-94 [Tanacetum coccineum]
MNTAYQIVLLQNVDQSILYSVSADVDTTYFSKLEAIRIFLTYTTYMGFVVYQKNIKSAFLNGKISDEVYVQQPPRFESNEFPNHVCKLDKALYGLKQALKAWYQANPKESHLVAVKRFFSCQSCVSSLLALEYLYGYKILHIYKSTDIIVNGDLQEEPAPTGEQASPSAPPAPKTAKQLAAKRNQERVKSILLLAIHDEYLLKFHNVPDAKSLWEAIKSRFGDQVDIDDLYNNLRVYEDEMKRSSSSTSTSQNLAFLSSENTSSTKEVNTASGEFGVNTAGGTCQVSSTPCAHEAACSFFAKPITNPQLENEDFQQIDGDDLEELNL